ncbi:MAG TPA: phosphoenolpyruvate hydrolase family protein [Dongiaceae bacterium]|jgi:predicted TIM-barrel enzyme|nr:phosphoenolpyruvate hydrolase family protein [Dongiaceae bacterium]
MGTRYTRADILQRLNEQIAMHRSLLVVGAGNGLVARCAEAAGADLIVVYNSGFYRLNGHPSLLGNLPIGDANEVMLTLGSRNVIPATKAIPVIGGVYGVDPTRDKRQLFESMQLAGYSGIINFPTVGRIDGQYRKDLEASGLGFQREVEAVALARSMGLFTMCYVYSPSDARSMAEAGVDVLVGHVGLTAGGDVGSTNAMQLDLAVATLNEIFRASLTVRNDLILLSHGGPIVSPSDAEYVNMRTDAVGFVAASSIERIPIETTIKRACTEFKGVQVTG